MANNPTGTKLGAASRPCMANNPAGTKLGVESHNQILSMGVVPFKEAGHWGVENSLHWSLDVTFGEDKSRIRRGNAPEIAGALRRQCSLDPQAGHFSEKMLDSRQKTPGRYGATMSSKGF